MSPVWPLGSALLSPEEKQTETEFINIYPPGPLGPGPERCSDWTQGELLQDHLLRPVLNVGRLQANTEMFFSTAASKKNKD